MKSFFNKLSLLLLCSAALFTQIKAENYQQIIDNLNIIQQNIAILQENVGKHPRARRTASKAINKALSGLPKEMKNKLNFLIPTIKTESMQKEEKDRPALTTHVNDLSAIITQEMGSAKHALQQEQMAQNATWGGYLGSKASQVFSGVKSVPGLAYGAAMGITTAAVSPITWSVRKLLDETDETKLAEAEMKLHTIDAHIEDIMQQIQEAKQTMTPQAFADFQATANESLNKLNAQARPYRITLGEIDDSIRLALYAGSAVMVSAILAYIDHVYTDGQMRTALIDTGSSIKAKMKNVYRLARKSSFEDFKQYVQGLWNGKPTTKQLTSNELQDLENLKVLLQKRQEDLIKNVERIELEKIWQLDRAETSAELKLAADRIDLDRIKQLDQAENSARLKLAADEIELEKIQQFTKSDNLSLFEKAKQYGNERAAAFKKLLIKEPNIPEPTPEVKKATKQNAQVAPTSQQNITPDITPAELQKAKMKALDEERAAKRRKNNAKTTQAKMTKEEEELAAAELTERTNIEPAQEPTMEPIPEQEPTMEPIPEQEPTMEPIPEQEPAMEPIPEQEPTMEPIPEQEPTMEPIPEQEPTMEPIPEQEPTMEQLPEQEPTMEQLPEQEPTMEQLPEQLPEQEPTMEPIPEQEPTTEQLPEQEPTMEPIPEQEPTMMNLSKTGPELEQELPVEPEKQAAQIPSELIMSPEKYEPNPMAEQEIKNLIGQPMMESPAEQATDNNAALEAFKAKQEGESKKTLEKIIGKNNR